MFTGIVEEVGTVAEAAKNRLRITGGLVMESLAVSDSIALNGVCLTVVERTGDVFTVDVVEETLSRTNLGALQAGDIVNLERALTPSSRMGGHIVQGHVDGTGVVDRMSGSPEERMLWVTLRPELMRYVVEKGFIALDGISLTVAETGAAEFSVAVVPYTAEHTSLKARAHGDRVNIEIDILAKYVERLTSFEARG